MPKNTALRSVHQSGEAGEEGLIESGASAVDNFGGKVFVRWDPDAHVTGFGPVAYFLEFLKTNGLWQSWVQDCPLHYRNANAPPKQDTGSSALALLFCNQCDFVDDRFFREILVSLSHQSFGNLSIEVRFAASFVIEGIEDAE